MGWRPSSCVNILFSRNIGPILTKLGCSICRVRRQEIVNSMTPNPQEEVILGVKSVKFMYFFKNLLLYSQAQIGQTKYIVMVTKEGSTKIVNFMTPRAGVLVLGRVHICHKICHNEKVKDVQNFGKDSFPIYNK